MSVLLSDLRTLIPDKPKLIPPPQDSPETIGRGDGAGTNFYLTRTGFVTGTLTMYSSTDSQTWVQISSGWTIDPNGQLIVFSTAPAAGEYIGARYQVEWFSDTELNTFLVNAVARGYSSDYQTALHVKLQAIGILMSNPDLVLIKHYGDRYDDTNALMKGFEDQIKYINEELVGRLTPNKSTPFAVLENGRYSPYVPRR